MIGSNDIDRIVDFLEERLASSRLEALSERNNKEHKLIINGECIGYAGTLEFVKAIKHATNQQQG